MSLKLTLTLLELGGFVGRSQKVDVKLDRLYLILVALEDAHVERGEYVKVVSYSHVLSVHGRRQPLLKHHEVWGQLLLVVIQFAMFLLNLIVFFNFLHLGQPE